MRHVGPESCEILTEMKRVLTEPTPETVQITLEKKVAYRRRLFIYFIIAIFFIAYQSRTNSNAEELKKKEKRKKKEEPWLELEINQQF